VQMSSIRTLSSQKYMYGNLIEYLFVLANISRFVMHIPSLPSNREIFIIKKKENLIRTCKIIYFSNNNSK
jgi:hypothetical protein